MTLFDLLLILLVLASIAGTVIALAALLFRRRGLAVGTLAAIVGAWIAYLGIGTAVALASPQHIMKFGEDRCFDEMCFAVMGYHRLPATNPGKALYLVEVRISNQSGGRAQREIGRKGVLVDRAGHVYEVSTHAIQAFSPVGAAPYPGLDAEVAPGQKLETKLVFELPENVDYPGFALSSDLKFNPAKVVICDEDHFLHWPTVVPLY
jgi:hypothetical protein